MNELERLRSESSNMQRVASFMREYEGFRRVRENLTARMATDDVSKTTNISATTSTANKVGLLEIEPTQHQ